MRLTAKIVINIVFALAVIFIGPVLAQTPPYTLDEAVALVKKKIGGRVVRAETTQKDERTIYEIRILSDDGRVRTIDVDMHDGIQE